MPSERDYLYYSDHIDTVCGWRRRVFLIPASQTPLSLASPYPAFGGEPDPLSGWAKMPAGAIGFGEAGDAGFAPDGLPVGVPNAASRKLVLRHELAHKLSGLASAITNYTAAIEFTGPVTSADWLALGANVWTITCDMGDRSLTWDQFPLEYQGVQRLLPEKPGTLILGRRVVQQLDLYETSAYVLEQVTMHMVCTEVAASPVGTPAVEDGMYDIGYTDADGHVVAVTNNQEGSSAELFDAGILYPAMGDLCTAFYTTLLRGAFTWAPAPSVQCTDAGGSSGGHPMKHIDFYDQNYEDDLERGDNIVETQIIGQIWTDQAPLAVVGGLLAEQKDDADTFNTKRACFEWLRAECEGSFCRMVPFYDTIANISLRFMGVLANPLGSISISRVVIDGGDDDAGVDFAEGGNVIANAKIAMLTTGASDIAEAESKAFGFRVEKAAQAQLSLHNVPNVGEGGRDMIFDSSGSISLRDLRRPLYAWYNVFYYATALGSSGPRAFRAHHNCTINHNATTSTTTGHTTPITAPTRDYLGSIAVAQQLTGSSGPDVLEAVYAPLLAATYTIQSEGGLTNGVAKAYTEIFGTTRITRYTVTIPTTLAGYGDIGRVYNLSPTDVNGHHSAQSIMGTDDVDVTHLYGSCLLLHVKPYIGYDTSGNEGSDGADAPAIPLSECTLLGISFNLPDLP